MKGPKKHKSTCEVKLEVVEAAVKDVKAKIEAYEATVAVGVAAPVVANASAAIPEPAALAVSVNSAPTPPPPAPAAAQSVVHPADPLVPAPAAAQAAPSASAQPVVVAKRKRTPSAKQASGVKGLFLSISYPRFLL